MTILLRTGISSILLFLLVFIPETRAGAQPSGAPIGSFPDIFTYYDPSDINTPAGADVTSKSIILLDHSEVGSGTSFLIRTFRDDDKVCMCLTGHQVNALFSNGAQPIVGSSVHFDSDIYMNYLGSDSIGQVNGTSYHFNKRATPFDKGYLSTGQLAAYGYGAGNDDPDIALVLVDKRELPPSSFATLGYDFTDAGWYKDYYSMGYPHAYPQRIMDGYSTYDLGVSSISISRQPPGHASGPAASGSPVLKRPTALSLGSPVRGVFDGTPGGLFSIPFTTDLFSTDTLEYYHNLRFTKIGKIENAIRRHCWKKSDSTQISTSESYKQSVQIDNSSSISPYTQNQSLTSAASVTSSAAGFTEQLSDGNIQTTTYLKANQSNISGFTLPAIYPGSTHPWHLTVAAREINVNANFDYTATGSSELHLATVVIGSATSAVSKHLPGITGLSPQASDTASGFAVYPNPSSSGVFYLSLPADNNHGNGYHLKVFSADGRQVYQGVTDAGQRSYPFNLTHLSRGAYILGVYKGQTGEKIFSKTIIY